MSTFFWTQIKAEIHAARWSSVFAQISLSTSHLTTLFALRLSFTCTLSIRTFLCKHYIKVLKWQSHGLSVRALFYTHRQINSLSEITNSYLQSAWLWLFFSYLLKNNKYVSIIHHYSPFLILIFTFPKHFLLLSFALPPCTCLNPTLSTHFYF